MKYSFLLILFLLSSKCFSQEKISKNNVYFENGITYNSLNDKMFTGIAQDKNKQEHIRFEGVYENGMLIKTLLYYNINSKQIVSDETFFNPENKLKIQHIRYSSDGKKYWVTKFDRNEKKVEFSAYENEIMISQEKYLNGKKNGMWFCLNEDGSKCEMEYKLGKKIKDCQ